MTAKKATAKKKDVAVIPQVNGIVGGLDQAKPLPRLSEFLEIVTKKVSGPKATLKEAFAVLDNLAGLGKLSATGTAAALWHMREKWETLTGKDFDTVAGRDADFQEAVFHEIGYQPDTTRRYCLAMDFIQEAKVNLGAKSEAFEALLQRDIKDLIGLGQYQNEHGLLTKKQLVEASQEPDASSLRKKLNEFKGQEPAQKGLTLTIEPDGTIMAWVGDNGEQIGSLLDEEELNEQGRRGRKALITRSKAQER